MVAAERDTLSRLRGSRVTVDLDTPAAAALAEAETIVEALAQTLPDEPACQTYLQGAQHQMEAQPT